MSYFNQGCLDQNLSDEVKKQQRESDYQNQVSNHGQQINSIFQQSQYSQDKHVSQYMEQYFNFFNLSHGYKLQPPKINDELNRNLRKNNIRYLPQYFSNQIKIKFKRTSPSYSVITVDVYIGYFIVSMMILNLETEMSKKMDMEGNQIQNDLKGNFGQILLIDWQEFLNSKYIIEIQDMIKVLQFEEIFQIQKQYDRPHSQYATKIFYFKHNKAMSFQKTPYKYQKIYEVMIEYAICKIASCFKIGLSTDHPFGFDLVCYKNCVQFFMQKGQQITEDLFDDIEILTGELKKKLLILHSLHIVHRDVKYDNLLYSPKNNSIVFIDFGLSEAIFERIGQKSKTMYKGSYFFLSDQVKKLMFEQENFSVDLYWNDAVGLIKTKNMLKNLINNPSSLTYQDTCVRKILTFDHYKEKRIDAMKNYFKIQTFAAITKKFVSFNIKIIQKFEKPQYLQWIKMWLSFIQGLQSCPIYDSFKHMFKKQLGQNTIFELRKYQNNRNQNEKTLKQQFLHRYKAYDKYLKVQLVIYDESWKKPLEMVCQQYQASKSKSLQFSILTYCASSLFQNINSTVYIFKQLFSLFPERILNYLLQNNKRKGYTFLFKHIGRRKQQKFMEQYKQSERHMIVDDYLIEINKYSSILMTNYIEDTIFTYLIGESKIDIKESESKEEYTIKFKDQMIQKNFFIRKDVEERYLIGKSKCQKIILILFKIYIKQSSLLESQAILVNKIKKYCSNIIYLDQLLQYTNSHISCISEIEFERKLQQVKLIISQIKGEDELKELKVSGFKTYGQKQNLNIMQYQYYFTNLKYEIFNKIDHNNAYMYRNQIINVCLPYLASIRFKMENEMHMMKAINALNLQIVCNTFLGNQFRNLQLIQRMHDLMSNIDFERDVFEEMQMTNNYIQKDITQNKKTKNKKFQSRTTRIDPNAVMIQFQDDKYSERFNFNRFMIDILKNCPQNRQEILKKLKSAIANIQQIQMWQHQKQSCFISRKLAYYINYLSVAFNSKFFQIYSELKLKIINQFKLFSMAQDKKQIKKINKLKAMQKLMQAIVDLDQPSQIQNFRRVIDQYNQEVQDYLKYQSLYPAIYWYLKIVRQQSTRKQQLNGKQINSKELSFYLKMIKYHPIQQNYFSLTHISRYLYSILNSNIMLHHQTIKQLIYRVLNHILNQQYVYFLIKFPRNTLKFLQYLVTHDQINLFMKVLAFLCKYLHQIKGHQDKKIYCKIVANICSSKQIRFSQQILQKINHQIELAIQTYHQHHRGYLQVAQISVFWMYLLFSYKQELSERILKKLAVLFDFISYQSRSFINRFYYSMGGIYYKKTGKIMRAKKFIKYDLRFNNSFNRQLYQKFVFTSHQLLVLRESRSYRQNGKQNIQSKQINKIGYHKQKIIQKIIELNKNNC